MREAFPRFEMPEGTDSAATSSEDPNLKPSELAREVRAVTAAEHPEINSVEDYLPYVEPPTGRYDI